MERILKAKSYILISYFESFEEIKKSMNKINPIVRLHLEKLAEKFYINKSNFIIFVANCVEKGNLQSEDFNNIAQNEITENRIKNYLISAFTDSKLSDVQGLLLDVDSRDFTEISKDLKDFPYNFICKLQDQYKKKLLSSFSILFDKQEVFN